MTLPDFTKIAFASGHQAKSRAAEFFNTPEGIPIASHYAAADLAGIPDLDTFPGLAPFLLSLIHI